MYMAVTYLPLLLSGEVAVGMELDHSLLSSGVVGEFDLSRLRVCVCV